jgi:YHS domain-containing protein
MIKSLAKIVFCAASLLAAVTLISAPALGQCCGEEAKAKAPASCSSSKSSCKGEGGAFKCPFSQCVVSNKKLCASEKPAVVEYKGRKIYFIDGEARKRFQADPEPFVAKYDKALIEVQSSFYPLDYCVVTGTKFSEKKKPVHYLHHGRLVRFCCSSLIPKFKESSKKYMAELDKAIVDQQLASYPLDRCVVSDIKLNKGGEDGVNLIYGNQLVRVNCNSCAQRFHDNPLKYMAKLYTAMMDAGKRGDKAPPAAAPKAGSVKADSSCCGSCGGKGTNL